MRDNQYQLLKRYKYWHAMQELIAWCLQSKKKNKRIEVGILSLIDLAGSESVGKAGTTGDRLTEGKAINKRCVQVNFATPCTLS